MFERRTVLQGLAGLSLTAVLADPKLARAAAEGLEKTTLWTAGGREVTGWLALPAKTPAPTVLVIHEWWGLNDQIKTMAAALAEAGYVALAVDLYNGSATENPNTANSLMLNVEPAEATDTLVSWVQWLKGHPKGNGRIGTIGWCFGGGWSLNASLGAPVDATIIYYGRCDKSAEELAPLRGPVLGHFAEQDDWINQEMVDDFEIALLQAGKKYALHWYDAKHAFANPTQAPRYDEGSAALAWERSLAFLKKNLG